jgi:hypothetical protein
MKTMKTRLALWLASRAEASARTTRRALRDHARRENEAATRADLRARGLRLWAAWNKTGNQKAETGKIKPTPASPLNRHTLPFRSRVSALRFQKSPLSGFPTLVRKAA